MTVGGYKEHSALPTCQGLRVMSKKVKTEAQDLTPYVLNMNFQKFTLPEDVVRVLTFASLLVQELAQDGRTTTPMG